jgi:hypothetical protein
MQSASADLPRTLLNLIGFQSVWLSCVIGAGNGDWRPGALAAAVFALLVLAFGRNRQRDLRTVAIALPIGFVMDSVLVKSEWLRYAGAFPWADWAPLWIMALWLAFALTLNHSLRAVYRSRLYTFLFGLLGGPLAYGIAAARFGAMTVEHRLIPSLLLIGAVWGIGFSAIRWLDRGISNHEEATP